MEALSKESLTADGGADASSAACAPPSSTDVVISESKNVVVQRLGIGNPIWNLTGSSSEGLSEVGHDGEIVVETPGWPWEGVGGMSTLGSQSLLSDAQLEAIGMAMSSDDMDQVLIVQNPYQSMTSEGEEFCLGDDVYIDGQPMTMPVDPFMNTSTTIEISSTDESLNLPNLIGGGEISPGMNTRSNQLAPALPTVPTSDEADVSNNESSDTKQPGRRHMARRSSRLARNLKMKSEDSTESEKDEKSTKEKIDLKAGVGKRHKEKHDAAEIQKMFKNLYKEKVPVPKKEESGPEEGGKKHKVKKEEQDEIRRQILQHGLRKVRESTKPNNPLQHLKDKTLSNQNKPSRPEKISKTHKRQSSEEVVQQYIVTVRKDAKGQTKEVKVDVEKFDSARLVDAKVQPPKKFKSDQLQTDETTKLGKDRLMADPRSLKKRRESLEKVKHWKQSNNNEEEKGNSTSSKDQQESETELKDQPLKMEVGEQREKRVRKERRFSTHSEEFSDQSDVAADEDDDDDDDNISWTSSDDPDRLWCICRKPHGNRFMISCDTCGDWFHGTCVGVTKKASQQLEKWFCPACIEKGEDHGTKEENSEKEESSGKEEKVVSQRVSAEEKMAEFIKGMRKRKDSKSEAPTSPTKKTSTTVKLQPPKQTCASSNCIRTAKLGTVYCSNECIIDHAKESMRLIRHDRNRIGLKVKSESPGSSKSSHDSGGHSSQPKERIAVIERHTGRIRKGETAPHNENLMEWLTKHPTYEIIKPRVRSHSSGSFYRKSQEEKPREVPKTVHKEALKTTPKEAPKTTPKEAPKAAPKATPKVPAKEFKGTKKGKIEQPPKPPTPSEDELRLSVRKALLDAFLTRLSEAKELPYDKSYVKKTCVKIEENLFKIHRDVSTRYKTKYRTLVFNIKDTKNQGLFRRILNKDLPAKKLVTMSSEELASKELLEWRERESKHSLDIIKQEEELRKSAPQLTKKTHKGEVEIEDDNYNTLEISTEKSLPKPKRDVIISKETEAVDPLSTLLDDTTSQHRAHLFDSNCKICTGKMAPPKDEMSPAKKAKVVHRKSSEDRQHTANQSDSSFDEEIMEKLVEMTNKAKEEMEEEYDPLATSFSPPPSNPSEAESASPPPQPKPTHIWKGSVFMPDVAKFNSAAYEVSGNSRRLSTTLGSQIHICGRIPKEAVWDYFKKLSMASTTEMVVIRLHVADDGDKAGYIALYQYFQNRNRIGVVGSTKSPIKDMYVLPLSSTEDLPASIGKLTSPGLEKTRPHLLLGLIVRYKGSPQYGPSASSSSSIKVRPSRSTTSSHRRSVDSNPSTVNRRRAVKEGPEEKRAKRSSSLPDSDWFIQGKQMDDPIVAEYTCADRSKLLEDVVEAYSPSQEEREAPYDPSDVLDDIPQPVKSAPEPGVNVDKLNVLLKNVSQTLPQIGSADNVPSEVKSNLLKTFDSDSSMTEQQQLLIHLTKQVEDAKKALLDKQIESLQSKINKTVSEVVDDEAYDPMTVTSSHTTPSSGDASKTVMQASPDSTVTQPKYSYTPEYQGTKVPYKDPKLDLVENTLKYTPSPVSSPRPLLPPQRASPAQNSPREANRYAPVSYPDLHLKASLHRCPDTHQTPAHRHPETHQQPSRYQQSPHRRQFDEFREEPYARDYRHGRDQWQRHEPYRGRGRDFQGRSQYH